MPQPSIFAFQGFQKLDPQAAVEQRQRLDSYQITKPGSVDIEDIQARKSGRETRDRMNARDRKRKERAWRKQKEIEDGVRDARTGKKIRDIQRLVNVLDASDTTVAALSRIGHSDWKKRRKGRRHGPVQTAYTRTNWFHPFLWRRIDAAAQRMSFSPTAIVRYLQREDAELFKTLWAGTVSHWMQNGKWTPATIRRVERGGTLENDHEPGIASSESSTLQDGRLTGGENSSEDVLFGTTSDRFDQVLNPDDSSSVKSASDDSSSDDSDLDLDNSSPDDSGPNNSGPDKPSCDFDFSINESDGKGAAVPLGVS